MTSDQWTMLALGAATIAAVVLSKARERVQQARAAQLEYDRRRAQAVLRALEASRD